MADSFAELSESDAPAHVANIYAQIRELTGVPMVALIFRHLATRDGVLEAVWEALGPVLRAGMVQDTAWALAREHGDAIELNAVRPRARAVVGLEGERLDALRTVLDAYNRANPVNMLCMLSLLQRANTQRAPRPLPAAPPWQPPAAIASLPPMQPVEQMSSEARWLINDLRVGDRSRLDPVVPSLFRHFADDPIVLALMHVLLADHFADGSIERAMHALEHAMRERAVDLAEHLVAVDVLAASDGALDVLSRFTRGLIPQMIVIGFALRRAFDADES